MFEAFIEMANQDLISFTATYENKGYISILDIDQKKLSEAKAKIEEKLKKENLSQEQYDERLEDELSEVESAKANIRYLSPDEEIALTQIDALKEELVQMIRKKSLQAGGKDSFQLSPNVIGKLNDDRAYVAAMAGWALQEKNRELMLSKHAKKDTDSKKMFKISKAPKKWGVFN